MLKAMIFIDGNWLYQSQRELSDAKVDYEKLPYVLTQKLRNQLKGLDVDMVRIHLFGSIPVNVDSQDQKNVDMQQGFYDMLKRRFHYEIEVYPIDFAGRRFSRNDRDFVDSFEPKEKCVDIALASSALYYATVPGAYDVAIFVIGDGDYIPAIQRIRRLGKRVMICSVRSNCAHAYDHHRDPTDEKGVRDFDTVFLEAIIGEVGLGYVPADALNRLESGYMAGTVAERKQEGYGFLHDRTGDKYYFHATNLENIEFSELKEKQPVQFIPGTKDESEKHRYPPVKNVKPL